MCDKLFDEFVDCDEEELAASLYMNINNLIELKENGHEIGIHGMNFEMGHIKSEGQEQEIITSYSFLKKKN